MILIIFVTKIEKRDEKINNITRGDEYFILPKRHLMPKFIELIISFLNKTKGKTYIETTSIINDRISFKVDSSVNNKPNKKVGIFNIILTKKTFNQYLLNMLSQVSF